MMLSTTSRFPTAKEILMKKLAAVFFSMFVFLAAGQMVFGCGCLPIEDNEKINFKKWSKNFDGAAFTGKVKSVEINDEDQIATYTFVVNAVWRGVDGPEVEIKTGANSGMCGVYYEEKETHTVFADKRGEELWTSKCSEIRYETFREGYLKVLGKPMLPPNTGGPAAAKVDEFVNFNCEDELARLDQLAMLLNEDPDSVGVIYVYGGQTGKRNEALARATRMAAYLEKKRSLGAHRIMASDAGFRESLTAEFFVWKPGVKRPEPSPTLTKKEVRFKGKAKVRKTSCDDEMGF